MSEFLSYAQFIKDRNNFRKSGTKSGPDFNIYDFQSHKFFKILFYFGEKESEIGLSNGLLAPTWEAFSNSNSSTDDYYNYNSAWAYLKLNAEDERAELLKQFVTLLSNISTFSPWYFTSISGLDAALTRNIAEVNAEKFELETNRKITINCLPDAFDDRISTLLELYREITWNWHQKKEVIPANLRKFDMAIYIFESPLYGIHDIDDKNSSTLDGSNLSSYKMLEFHDCEFNYNSIKSGWSEFSNETGTTPKYSIEISYGDCYEISYNDLLMKTLGDVIAIDTHVVINSENVRMNEEPIPKVNNVSKSVSGINNKKSNIPELDTDFFGNKKITYGNLENNNHNGVSNKQIEIEYDTGFLSNAVGQLIGTAVSKVKSTFNRAVLGNLYTYSLTQIGKQLKSAAQGNVIKTAQTIKQYRKNAQQRAAAKTKQKPTGNIFKDNTIANNI